MSSRRLYIGKLPPDARSDQVQDAFKPYGKIVDCKVMTGFGFIEFDSSRDAEDAIDARNGKDFMGAPIVVEFAKESRPRQRDPYPEDRGARARRPPGIRIIVTGISRDTSWQDLKDFGREAGSVSFADIDRDVPGQGILEYLTRDDAERAVKELDGKDLRGQPVGVALGDARDADNYRRDDRGGYGGRGGHDRGGYERGGYERGGYDRYSRDDRGYDRDRHSYRDAPPRRDRSRSPRRGGDEDRRAARSPPRRDHDAPRSGRDYDASRDDRRSARLDDDRPPRRDDDRRSRRGDEDDRAPPPRSGDGGWSR